MIMYEVSTHGYGCPIVRRGPAAGLPDFPHHTWKRITLRPIGIKRATALANDQDCHAVVCVWMTAEKVHDNCKPPHLPDGWVEAPSITPGGDR